MLGIRISVTLTNVGSQTKPEVCYGRFVDPDQELKLAAAAVTALVAAAAAAAAAAVALAAAAAAAVAAAMTSHSKLQWSQHAVRGTVTITVSASATAVAAAVAGAPWCRRASLDTMLILAPGTGDFPGSWRRPASHFGRRSHMRDCGPAWRLSALSLQSPAYLQPQPLIQPHFVALRSRNSLGLVGIRPPTTSSTSQARGASEAPRCVANWLTD